ncbi:hypothetical protein F4824DRAFT_500252 [Ustulina deusta]|nr:hypothetical protein F4824DRAFT_500252 [Ustulina deusta]
MPSTWFFAAILGIRLANNGRPSSDSINVSQSARTHIGNLRPPATVVEPGDPSLYYAAFKASAAMYIFEGSNLLARRTVVDTVDGLVGSRNIELVQSSVLNSPQLLSDILRSFDWTKSLLIHGHSFESILRGSREADINSSSPAPNLDEYIIDTILGGSSIRPVPVLLRQPEHEDTFTFVGEYCLDGFMDGAALEQRDFLEMVFGIE